MGNSGQKVTRKHSTIGLSLRIYHNPNGPLIHTKSSHNTYSDPPGRRTKKHLDQSYPSYILSNNSGSMTVEAAIVVPIFLLVIFHLLSYFSILQDYMRRNMNMYQNSCIISSCAYVVESDRIRREAQENETEVTEGITDECTDIVDIYQIKNLYLPSQRQFFLAVRARTRKWTGYNNARGEEQAVNVYITDNREVYHTTLQCTHLSLSIEKIDAALLEDSHNSYGETYSPCGFCIDGTEIDEYYITGMGDHYHQDPVCAGLVRRIRMVSLDEVGDLPPCSRCGAKESAE